MTDVSEAPATGTLARLGEVGLAVWLGAMIVTAFTMAPAVFASVPEVVPSKQDAGRLMAPIFARVDALGICAVALALWASWAGRITERAPWRVGVASIMLVLVVVDLTVVVPAVGGRREPVGTWHTLAVCVWMSCMVGAVALLAAGLRARSD